MLSTRVQAIFIFLGGLLLFTIGLHSSEIIGFESRFYLFALEMWRHGPTLFPMTYHQPYPDYPALSTWLIYACAKVMGGLSKGVAVFPSACASAITLSVTYLIGALHSRRLGWMSVFFLLFTVTFFAEARTISLDQFTTAITTICFYLVYSANERKKTWRVIWVFPLLVLGFAFRGPIGLVIPAGVVCLFYLLEKNVKRFFIIGAIAAFLLVLCSALLLWAAYHVGGMRFLHDVVQMEVFGRLQDVKTLPIYFYFQESFGAYAVTYPLAILIGIGLYSKREDVGDEKLLLQLIGWAAIILIGLSIPVDKKIRYILAMAPALALISGFLFVAKRDNNYLYVLRTLFIWVCFYFPLLCLIALYYLHQRLPDVFAYYYGLMALFFFVQLLMIGIVKFQNAIFVVAALTFVAAYILVIEPINQALNKTREFVLRVEDLRFKAHAPLAFYREGVDGLVIKYLVAMPKEEQPVFLNSNDELMKTTGPLFVITTESNQAYLPLVNDLHQIIKGKIGHEPVVVFAK